MELINRLVRKYLPQRRTAFAIVLLMAGTWLHAHSPEQLGAEIQSLEQRLPDSSPAERHSALVRLARLRQLAGHIAEAAVNWLDAAAADPDDDAAPAAAAYCLTAIGEWERAAATLKPLLASDRRGPAILQAWYLDACLKAWSAGDASALEALAGNEEFAALRPVVYYTLWQAHSRNPAIAGTGSAEKWNSRLLAEYPQSPEARASVAEKQKDSPVISAVHSPLWLLTPGTSVITFPDQPPALPVSADAEPPQTPSGIVLQTGLYSREANAHVQFEALRKAGFTATVSRKLVNGVVYWAVTVPAGQDSRTTTADLKKAGFDSFPVK